MDERTGMIFLSAAQAAARLGVKVETLYAYVSRGFLIRHRTPDGSRFDPIEVERFARNRRRNGAEVRARGRVASGSPMMVIDTEVALIEDGDLYFRGVPAVELASTLSFESAAWFVLTGDQHSGFRFHGDPESVLSARAVVDAMPEEASIRDLLQVTVTALGARDVLRATAEAATIPLLAPGLLGGMVDALPSLPGSGDPDASLAERLWQKLSPLPPDDARVTLLDAALVLLVEHDLAVSTLAARAAASARATPYAVVATGLAALDSALHGRSSRACRRLIAAVVAGEHPERALAEALRDSEHGLPGFGHPLYPDWDPRARYLLQRLEDSLEPTPVSDAVRRLISRVQKRTGLYPNIDLALAAIAAEGEMRATAAEGIFGISRSVGWLAHASEEYAQPPMRMRPSGRYVGL